RGAGDRGRGGGGAAPGEAILLEPPRGADVAEGGAGLEGGGARRVEGPLHAQADRAGRDPAAVVVLRDEVADVRALERVAHDVRDGEHPDRRAVVEGQEALERAGRAQLGGALQRAPL